MAYSVGIVTAYGVAVRGGYIGTAVPESELEVEPEEPVDSETEPIE